jgi:putative flippase GtrA
MTTTKVFDIQQAVLRAKKALVRVDRHEESTSSTAASTEDTFEGEEDSSSSSSSDAEEGAVRTAAAPRIISSTMMNKKKHDDNDDDNDIDLEQNNNNSSTILHDDNHPLFVREISFKNKKKTKIISCCSSNSNKSKSHKTATNSTTNSCMRRLVHCLQDTRVPGRRQDVPLVQGLDRMLLSTVPPAAAEVIRLAGWHPPRYLWYMISGALCDVVQIATLFFLHRFVVTNGTACWALGFLLSIPCRHTSHRYLVFGDYVGGYRKSLVRMYMGYSIIIVLSTLFNLIVSRLFPLPMSVLWILTLLWTGIANYFILKYFWSYGSSSSSSSANAAAAAVGSGGGGGPNAVTGSSSSIKAKTEISSSSSLLNSSAVL